MVKWSDDQLEKERRRSANSEKAEEGIEGEEGGREKRTWCYNFSASFFAKFFSPRRRGGGQPGEDGLEKDQGRTEVEKKNPAKRGEAVFRLVSPTVSLFLQKKERLEADIAD